MSAANSECTSEQSETKRANIVSAHIVNVVNEQI
jgi:hypothetical protein